MSTVLVIGAGGVGSVAVHKMAMNPDVFSQITLASRRRSKCDAIAASVKQRTGVDVRTAEEHARGAIAGSVNVPVDSLRDRIDQLGAAPVVVYCEVGQRGHTATAARRSCRRG